MRKQREFTPLIRLWQVLAGAGLLALLGACGDNSAHSPGDVRTSGSTSHGSIPQPYAGNGTALVPVNKPTRHANLILLVLDTLRADTATAGSTLSPTMPNLIALGEGGIEFQQASASAPWTVPSMASILTGMLPTEHGCADEQSPRLQESVVTYAEVLSAAYGYQTAAFSDVPWYRGGTGSLLQGFRHGSKPNPTRKPARDPFQNSFSLDALNVSLDPWIQTRDPNRPFFLLLHSFAPHDPYGEANHPVQGEWSAEQWRDYDAAVADFDLSHLRTPREEARTFMTDAIGRGAFTNAQPGTYVTSVCRFLWEGFRDGANADLAADLHAAYRQGANWVDGGIRRSIMTLDELGLLKDSLLVIVSDHGEAFGEHGTVGHGHHLYDELLRIPMVMRGPSPFDRPQALRASVGSIDILPTFFDWAGLTPIPDRHGRSLLPLLAAGAAAGPAPLGHPVLAEATVRGVMVAPGVNRQIASARTAEWKFIAEHDAVAGTVVEQVFDLRADPEERNNLLLRHALRDLPLPEAFCRALEAARARLSPEVEAVDALHGTPYGAGSEALTNWRPQESPCSDGEGG